MSESQPSTRPPEGDAVDSRPLPAPVEDAIRAAAAEGEPEQRALVLAAIATRAVAELNRLSRAEATARRGAASWPAWASLSNAARDAVLKLATCRKAATALASASRPPA